MFLNVVKFYHYIFLLYVGYVLSYIFISLSQVQHFFNVVVSLLNFIIFICCKYSFNCKVYRDSALWWFCTFNKDDWLRITNSCLYIFNWDLRRAQRNVPPPADEFENSLQTLLIHHSAQWRSNTKWKNNKQNTFLSGEGLESVLNGCLWGNMGTWGLVEETLQFNLT